MILFFAVEWARCKISLPKPESTFAIGMNDRIIERDRIERESNITNHSLLGVCLCVS